MRRHPANCGQSRQSDCLLDSHLIAPSFSIASFDRRQQSGCGCSSDEDSGISSQESSQSSQASSLSSQSSLEDERSSMTCKVCLDRRMEVVFVPCGHFVCCSSCSQSLHKCPYCRKPITTALKTYLS